MFSYRAITFPEMLETQTFRSPNRYVTCTSLHTVSQETEKSSLDHPQSSNTGLESNVVISS